jgi:hypothetical protein
MDSNKWISRVVDSNYLAEDRDWWQTAANTEMDLRLLQKAGYLSS